MQIERGMGYCREWVFALFSDCRENCDRDATCWQNLLSLLSLHNQPMLELCARIIALQLGEYVVVWI